MDTVKLANNIIVEATHFLTKPEQEAIKYRGLLPEQVISNACGMVNKDKRREATLKAFAVQEANRVIGILWRNQKLTPELEKSYRELPSMEDAAKDFNLEEEKRRAVKSEIDLQMKQWSEAEREFDLFKGVLNGMTKKEAEQEQKRYMEQVAKAQQR